MLSLETLQFIGASHVNTFLLLGIPSYRMCQACDFSSNLKRAKDADKPVSSASRELRRIFLVFTPI